MRLINEIETSSISGGLVNADLLVIPLMGVAATCCGILCSYIISRPDLGPVPYIFGGVIGGLGLGLAADLTIGRHLSQEPDATMPQAES
jgi:hypothetical protein